MGPRVGQWYRQQVVKPAGKKRSRGWMYVAVIIIALPIYLIHWLWAHRTTTREADERASIPRRLYLLKDQALRIYMRR